MLSRFQILFVRMIGTLILSFLYLWLAKVRDAPFGTREVRGLLLARGFGGFFGGELLNFGYSMLADGSV